MKDFDEILYYFPGKVGKLINDTVKNSDNIRKIISELKPKKLKSRQV